MNYRTARSVRYTAALACLLLNVCSLPHRATDTQDVARPATALGKDKSELEEDPLDPRLLALLNEELHIVKPFAWGALPETKERYQVVGIEEQGRLMSVILTKRAESYSVQSVEAYAAREDALIQASGSLNLKNLLTDREFPFRSEILRIQECTVHFVFVWRAQNRSFRRKSILTGIDLRIIVERESHVLSNDTQGLFLFAVSEASSKDLNGDRRQDYVLIGVDNSKHIYAWTVLPDCSVTPVRFESVVENERQRVTLISGRNVFLQFDERTRNYSIHAQLSEPYLDRGVFHWRITESIYTWNKREGIYKLAKKYSWLQKG